MTTSFHPRRGTKESYGGPEREGGRILKQGGEKSPVETGFLWVEIPPVSGFFWRQEQRHHSGGDDPATFVGLMVALRKPLWGPCVWGRTSFLPGPFLYSVHHGLNQNGVPRSLNCRAEACVTMEERKGWGAKTCLSFQCHKATSMLRYPGKEVRPDPQAGNGARVLWGAFGSLWGFFTTGRTWMSPDWSPAVNRYKMECKAARLLPGGRQPFLSPFLCERCGA